MVESFSMTIDLLCSEAFTPVYSFDPPITTLDSQFSLVYSTFSTSHNFSLTMFTRSILSRLCQRTALRRAPAMKLPEGFSFTEKLDDKPIQNAYENFPKMTLTFTRQDDLIMNKQSVDNVSLATSTGEIGVRSGHEYKIAKLVPGVISIEKEPGQEEKYFTSGGFAHINNDGSVDINTVEAIPLEDFEPNFVDRELLKHKDDLKSAKSEKERAIADVYISVYEALSQALKKL